MGTHSGFWTMSARVFGVPKVAAIGSAAVAAVIYYDENIRRQSAIAAFGGAARVFVRGANRLTIHDGHHLENVLSRPAGTGLLSVSNHIATMDDPGLLAAIVPLGTLLSASRMRWVC